MSWRVDQDYLDDLPEDAAEWLGRFNDAYYGATTSAMVGWTPEERRAAYAAKNAANRDIYTAPAREPVEPPASLTASTPAPDSAGPLPDLAPAPAYLDDPEYRAARAELRASNPTDLRRKAPREDADLRRARKQLAKVVKK